MAIDDLSGPRPRDAAMAETLQAQLASKRYDRAVVLVGNLHAIGQIRWRVDAGRRRAFLAERLARAGVRVVSVMQALDEDCPHRRHPVFYSTMEPAAWTMIGQQVQVAKHHPQMDMSQAANGIVAWSCPQQNAQVRSESRSSAPPTDSR